jgi:glucose-1-phosphate adenylyltransferase
MSTKRAAEIESDSLLRRSTLAIVMGGGAGTRLFPLTKDRAKPAVPLAGKYRIVDLPISNCINSGLRQVYVLTQFNSASLNRHLNRTYRFDQFTRGFVEVLAAQQTPDGERWYQGTADAVRQNMRYFLEGDHEHFLILSGDQLYRMDFRKLMRQHVANDADITIATLPVNERDATGFGIMHSDESGRITEFVEKPKDPEVLAKLRMSGDIVKSLGIDGDEPRYQASMGIYLFNRKILDNGSVGIYHETIMLSDANVETVYGNMPTFGLAGVTGAVTAQQRGQSARTRLTGAASETPAVDPY